MDNSQYGITEYVGEKDLTEIPCVIKLLYSDFIVVEIDNTKHVLEPEAVSDEESQEANGAEIKVECDESNVSDQPAIKRPKLFSEEDETNILNVASGQAESHLVRTENVDKEERKLAHEYIRKRFGSTLVSNGEQNAILIKRPDKRHPDNRQRHEPWPKSRGDYLHFVLTKENHDHMYALSVAGKMCGNFQPKAFVKTTRKRIAWFPELHLDSSPGSLCKLAR
ncbi:putative pseudouridine synthase [Ditylenchus destructor]|nr:putative pseudouridine synthase [Ditylenchus destructor]